MGTWQLSPFGLICGFARVTAVALVYNGAQEAPASKRGPAASAAWADERVDHARTRYRQHGVHAAVHEPGDAHDARAGVLLRRARRPEERPRDHDAELRVDGLDDHHLVRRRLLAVLFWRRRRDHRQPR